jgi:hypothetical protein
VRVAVQVDIIPKLAKDERFPCITHSTAGPLVRAWIQLLCLNGSSRRWFREGRGAGRMMSSMFLCRCLLWPIGTSDSAPTRLAHYKGLYRYPGSHGRGNLEQP